MNLTLIVADNCNSGTEVETKLKNILKNRPHMRLEIRNIMNSKSSIVSIVPALFIENDLFSYGDFEKNRLLSYIETRISKE